MPSIFGHAMASSALGYAFFPQQARMQGLALAALCAMAPDADVIAFSWGIPYESIWGHRGWTHSIAFAAGLGLTVSWLFYRRQRRWLPMALWFISATVSHPLLDMATTGGLGCALGWPFSEERFFLPWRVIRVSPLEVGEFFSKNGLRILASEAFWIGLPGLAVVVLSRWKRRQGKCY